MRRTILFLLIAVTACSGAAPSEPKLLKFPCGIYRSEVIDSLRINCDTMVVRP